MTSSTPHSSKGPWQLPTAGTGGLPITTVDDPITAVFLFLFVLGAATHMTILQVNLRRGKKFIMSGMLFGFCMARITAATLRLVWSTHPKDVSIAIAANIFMAAGVLLLFIIDLIFTQRVMRATHANWAWSKWFSLMFKIYYASIVVILIALITATVQSFYTLNPHTRHIDRTIQLFGQTYFAVAAFLPLPLLAINYILPHSTGVEKFGEGRMRTKVYVLIFTSTLLTFGAAFRAGTNYFPRPIAHPAWYHSKPVFYCINFLIEIIVVALFAVIRVDKRFIVPDGSKGPGHYSAKQVEEEAGMSGLERTMSHVTRTLSNVGRTMSHVNNEEDLFDDVDKREEALGGKKMADLEAGRA